MKVLITGGAGFIGSHLAEYLLHRGDEVWVVDNLSTGARKNISHLEERPGFTFVEGSVLDSLLMDSLIAKVDQVYHLAASVGVRLIVNKLVDSIENNVKGTESILLLANKHKKKVLLTSTSEVYGRAGQEPFRESDDLRMGETTKTRWSYACSKALDEYLGFAYYHEHGLPVTVARLFNTVGERQTSSYGMVIPTFVGQAIANKPITIYGSGTQTRCFCHVSDVVQALAGIMGHKGTAGEVYNIGGTEEISMTELADTVIRVLGSKSEKVFIPYEEVFKVGFDDIDKRVPNVEKIHGLIDFKTTVSLEDIIRRVASAIKAEKQEKVSV